MDPQLEPFIQTIDQLHDDIYRGVAPLTDAEINWRHPHLSNTIGILVRHIAGSERYWIVEIVGGRPIQRRRQDEFEAERLEKDLLVEWLRAAQTEVTELITGLAAVRLHETVELTFRGQSRAFTKSWAIMHSIQHTAYHLGQIQLFRRMATSGKAEQLRPGRAP